MEKLWTTSEVAKFLGVTEVDVEQLVKEGKLTGYKLGGRFLRFRPDQVEHLKGAVRFRPVEAAKQLPEGDLWYEQVLDFFYFYDFYLIAAVMLAILVVYLIISA